MIHKCSLCSKIHTEVPDNARSWIEDKKVIGFVWECDCKNTLFEKNVDEIQIIADIYEALEKLNTWKPVYLALLKVTGNKALSLEVIGYLAKLEEEE